MKEVRYNNKITQTNTKDIPSITMQENNPLVDWKNPPKVSDLKADYEEALSSYHSHVTQVDTWLANLAGELKVSIPKGRSKVQPKLIRKQAEWRYSGLEEPFLSTENMFEINPATFLDKDSAIQNKLILNKQINSDIDKVHFINEYVRTCVDEGTAIVRVGWESIEGEVREEVEVPDYATAEEAIAYIQQAIQSGEMSEEQATEILATGQPIQIGVHKEVRNVVKEIVNRPVLEVCNYKNIIIDPSCEGDFEEAQFLIYKFTTDLSTLRKDGRYKNLDKIIPSNNTPLSEPDYPSENTAFTFKDVPRQKFIAYEYWGFWDIDNSGVVKPIVATYVGDTMVRLEENPYPHKKIPFVVVPYLPVRKSVFGEPDGSLLEDNQAILGAVTRGILDTFGRSANGQQGIRKDALDPINKKKFDNGDDFLFNPNVHPDTAFYMGKYPEIPNSAMEVIALQNNEAESLTGVKAFTGGISGQALGNSVGGIRSALDATAKRELSILRRLSKGIIDIGKMIISMNSVWLSDEEIIRISDSEFVSIKRDDLAGTFDLKLDVSTAETDNQKASELAFMLQTLGNSVPFGITKEILVDIANLRKMPSLAKRISEYKPQPDPMDIQIKQLTVAKLQAEVYNEQMKARENEMDIALKQAKTNTEIAKARSLGATTDLQDLAFVEQSEGITHDRELEKEVIKVQMKNKNSNKVK